MSRPFPMAFFSCALLFGALSTAAPTSARAMPCDPTSLRSVANRTHGKLNACVVQRKTAVLETTYYQNASKVGGTALAAFPEVRLRYGVAPHVEAFVDGPSEIAKSGAHGAGIYIMTHPGYGAKIEIARVRGVVYSLVGESHPPLNALANMYLSPNSEVYLDANWMDHNSTLGLEVGQLNFSSRRHHRNAATVAALFARPIDRATTLSMEFGYQSVACHGATSQFSGRVALQRAFSERMLFNVELGTTFNATGNSKPHYLGAGFVIR